MKAKTLAMKEQVLSILGEIAKEYNLDIPTQADLRFFEKKEYDKCYFGQLISDYCITYSDYSSICSINEEDSSEKIKEAIIIWLKKIAIINPFIFLTSKNVLDLIGKTVEWYAPAASGNKDYHGVDKIVSVDLSIKHCITTEHVSGYDNLNGSFLEPCGVEQIDNRGNCKSTDEYNNFSYSDWYREVIYRVCE